MNFSQGDVVNVKSGGPALTVLSVDGGHVKCLFFSEEIGEFRETVIPAFALQTFEEETDESEDAEDNHDDEDDSDHDDDESDEDDEGGRKRGRKAA